MIVSSAMRKIIDHEMLLARDELNTEEGLRALYKIVQFYAVHFSRGIIA